MFWENRRKTIVRKATSRLSPYTEKTNIDTKTTKFIFRLNSC